MTLDPRLLPSTESTRDENYPRRTRPLTLEEGSSEQYPSLQRGNRASLIFRMESNPLKSSYYCATAMQHRLPHCEHNSAACNYGHVPREKRGSHQQRAQQPRHCRSPPQKSVHMILLLALRWNNHPIFEYNREVQLKSKSA